MKKYIVTTEIVVEAPSLSAATVFVEGMHRQAIRVDPSDPPKVPHLVSMSSNTVITAREAD